MRITCKGQVTIPGEIREKAGLLPGTEVEFVLESGGVYLKKVEGRHPRGRALVDALRGKGTVKMTTEEILALTRGQ
ncbi:MAG: AbrB/MazE/SpoVT family DNA-binding domain-containing protein [Planctomycetes bacterium]|nr:AbrB/MazE/SpoVT family DNA-binding domain-containing protein [Planctomycetota bacterium]